jgi:hypothetical protein
LLAVMLNVLTSHNLIYNTNCLILSVTPSQLNTPFRMSKALTSILKVYKKALTFSPGTLKV